MYIALALRLTTHFYLIFTKLFSYGYKSMSCVSRKTLCVRRN